MSSIYRFFYFIGIFGVSNIGNAELLKLNSIKARFNGPVLAAVISGNSGYFAGDFSAYQASFARGFSALNLNDGELSSICNLSERLNVGAKVFAIESTDTHLFLGGKISRYDDHPVQNLIKIEKSSCNLDNTFSDSSGFAYVVEDEAQVRALAIFNGAIYVGGGFDAYRGQPVYNIAKIDIHTGELDRVFSQESGFSSYVETINISNDSLFVGGGFNRYRGKIVRKFAKLDLLTGQLDRQFSAEKGFSGVVVSKIINSDKDLYVGGMFEAYRGTPVFGLAKIDSESGDLDTSFSKNLGFNDWVSSLVLLENSLFVGGSFTSYRGQPADRIAKIDKQTGELDNVFSQPTGFDEWVESLAVVGQSLFVGGGFSAYRGAPAQRLAKIDVARGQLDVSFTRVTGFAGKSIREIRSLNNNLYVGGEISAYRGIPAERIAKVSLQTGQIDTQFSGSPGFNDSVSSLILHGGSLYAGGSFDSYRGLPAQRLAKLEILNGNLDTSFVKTTGFSDQVSSLGVEGASLYVGGRFQSYRNSPAKFIAKLNLIDGALDNTFVQANGFDGFVNVLLVKNNAVYVGGQFSSYRDIPVQGLAKLERSTGALDQEFSLSVGFDGPVNSLAELGSSVYVGGSFLYYRGVRAAGIAKIHHTSGEIDSGFSQSQGFENYVYPEVNCLNIRGNALFVGGAFKFYRGSPAQGLAKVNLDDGELDSTFTKSMGFDGVVNTITRAGNAIYVGGGFNSYRGVPENSLVELDPETGEVK